MSKNTNLRVNNRWKMDIKDEASCNQRKNKKDDIREDNYYNQRKNKKDNIKRRSKFDMLITEEKKEEKNKQLNMFNNESFPELVKVDQIGDGKNDYLEKIKKQKEIDEVKIKLKPGWVEYRKRKNKLEISRDGINYHNSLRETYTVGEWDKKEMDEFDKEIQLMTQRLDALYLKRKKESDDYYYETGNLDSFALAEQDSIEYDKYVKKFDEDAVEMQESSDDEHSDEEGYDSDNKYKYR